MSTIVPTLAQAVENIERFEEELDRSKELQRRLAFARSWYAVLDEDGAWLFAPSKFCGYKDMTAAEYINDDPRDGRRTEKQLQQWFTQVHEEEALFAQLSEGLTAFLARYGKPPSTAFRISVTNEFYDERNGEGDARDDRAIAELLILVGRRLPADERARVRAAL